MAVASQFRAARRIEELDSCSSKNGARGNLKSEYLFYEELPCF